VRTRPQLTSAPLVGLRRRRECHGCGYRFTTYEFVAPDNDEPPPQTTAGKEEE
jgi:Transcriptional repressor NrdR-like, N-terminal domain